MAIETSFIIAFILTTTFINFSINSKLGFIFCLVSFGKFHRIYFYIWTASVLCCAAEDGISFLLSLLRKSIQGTAIAEIINWNIIFTDFFVAPYLHRLGLRDNNV